MSSPRKDRVKALFKKGQRCLVRYPDQYYAAVVLRARKTDNGYFYLIHYDGWSKKHDEEVHQADMIKFNAELEGTAPEEGTARDAAPGMALAAGGHMMAKRRRTDTLMAGINPHAEIVTQLRLHIPPLLKQIALDDYRQVNNQGNILALPRPKFGRASVATILRDYEEKVYSQATKDGEDAGFPARDPKLTEVLTGLLKYFDSSLRHFLLYHQEVSLCDEVLADGSLPRDIFGGEHLVRLSVKLAELVPVEHSSQSFVVALEDRLHDLLLFLADSKNQAKYFAGPEEYTPNPDAPRVTLPPTLLSQARGAHETAAGTGTATPITAV